MNIVILGPQGSGKGTQAELLAERYNLIHIETGRLLRQMANSSHPLSTEVKRIMNEGNLISDVILREVISDEVNKYQSGNGFVFDGTPRNIEQYGLIKKILDSYGKKIDKVIVINLSEEETLKRLSSRRTCVKCGKVYNIITKPSPNGDLCECGEVLGQREDDKPGAIRKRLGTYNIQTSAVIDIALKEGVLMEINGERPIEVIFNDIVKVIDEINAKNTGKN